MKKVIFLREAFPTHITSELSRMKSQMFLECWSVTELSATGPTFVRLFSSVYSFMAFHMLWTGKTFVTKATFQP